MAERIGAARDAVVAGIQEDVARHVFDLREAAVQRYVIGLFKGLSFERLHGIFLDGSGHYLTDTLLASGNLAHLSGNLRQIVSRGLDVGATGVVLIHNHPSGDPAPSQSDIETTRRLKASLSDLELHLVDHLIVAGMTILSMRGANLL